MHQYHLTRSSSDRIFREVLLGAQGIISKDDSEKIVEGLKSILEDIESGKLEITDEYEDIHTFVEANLIERIGDAGKRLHTGRSRNDQVALDMKLYTRDEIGNVDEELRELLQVILRIMKENVETYMPGFTHMQKAQPVTVAHHFGAYFEMFKRDRSRLSDIFASRLRCPRRNYISARQRDDCKASWLYGSHTQQHGFSF